MLGSFEVNDEQWTALTETLLLANFQYGRQALYPVIESIITNLQAICEVYGHHSQTCTQLLTQVTLSFNKEEYESRVLAPIMACSAKEPALELIVESLRNLRKFLGDDMEYISNSFSREVALLPTENRTELFKRLCRTLCLKAIQETIQTIQALPQKNENKASMSIM